MRPWLFPGQPFFKEDAIGSSFVSSERSPGPIAMTPIETDRFVILGPVSSLMVSMPSSTAAASTRLSRREPIPRPRVSGKTIILFNSAVRSSEITRATQPTGSPLRRPTKNRTLDNARDLS